MNPPPLQTHMDADKRTPFSEHVYNPVVFKATYTKTHKGWLMDTLNL